MTAGDGEPPREATADALARLYDVDLLEDPGDAHLYLALAARTGGPILELGVGSGRVAIQLAMAGYQVAGFDLDPAMLGRAARCAHRAGSKASRNITLINADARIPPEGVGRFRLAIIALNSLLVFGERRDQQKTVAAMAAHLEPGGIAVIDVWLPSARDLARYDARVGLEYIRTDPETGRVVTKLASATHDTASGTVDLSVIYDEGAPGEPPCRWIRRDRLRLVSPDELRAFAEDAGLEVETIAGGYDLEPIGPGDERAIVVATKPLSGPRSSHERAGIRAAAARAGPRPRSGPGSGLV